MGLGFRILKRLLSRCGGAYGKVPSLCYVEGLVCAIFILKVLHSGK